MSLRASRRTRRALLVVVLALAVAGYGFSDVPTRLEQFLFSIVAYNGRDYSGTFVREPVDSLYLLADADNFIAARKTMVYYWPITGDYRLDTDTIDIQFDGKLRITGNGVDTTLQMQKYTYYNVRGEYELNWMVAKGAAAEATYTAYEKSVSAYQQAVFAYQQARSDYQHKLLDLTRRITTLRSEGADTSGLLAELKSMKEPAPPESPNAYSSPPVAPQKAFVVNLPVGMYRIELINPDGTIMQGSEKRLVVFSGNGAQQVGYDVIPADKWTRPESSQLPGSVLYVDGSTDLYLRPFFELQYNDLYHEKLVNNDARGNPNMSSWVTLQQVPNAEVALRRGSAATREKQESFGVQQLPGSTLGYKIVAWADMHHQPDQKPDIIAYHVPVSRSDRVVHVTALDEHGTRLSGSGREIRIIRAGGAQPILLLLVLLPLLAGGVVMATRARRYRA